ncbi:MAG: PEP-CTERM sorting domain-containing protein [Desulfarculus sp.]|nr:PEP-CTERM sorting domain-containing protein [Desulfarculus sp.]
MYVSARKTAGVVWVALLVVGLTFGLARSAAASSFEFGGDNRIKVQSGGFIDPYYTPVTSSSSPGDSVSNYRVGIERLNLFKALGVTSVKVGQTYSGFDYTFGSDLDFWLTDGKVNLNSPARNQEPSSYEFAGRIHLTSITFANNWEINLTGYLSDITIAPAVTSAVLNDLAQADRVNLSLTLAWGSKTSGQYGSFVNVLNSKDKSSWASLSGSLSGSSLSTVPEPSTALLLASSLGVGAWLRRRRRTPSV